MSEWLKAATPVLPLLVVVSAVLAAKLALWLLRPKEPPAPAIPPFLYKIEELPWLDRSRCQLCKGTEGQGQPIFCCKECVSAEGRGIPPGHMHVPCSSCNGVAYHRPGHGP